MPSLLTVAYVGQNVSQEFAQTLSFLHLTSVDERPGFRRRCLTTK